MQKAQKIFTWKLLVCKINSNKPKSKLKEKLKYVQHFKKKIKVNNKKLTDFRNKSKKFFKTHKKSSMKQNSSGIKIISLILKSNKLKSTLWLKSILTLTKSNRTLKTQMKSLTNTKKSVKSWRNRTKSKW